MGVTWRGKKRLCLLLFVGFAVGCATNVNFEIAPGTVTLEVGQSQSFTAAGASGTNLQWSVNGIPGGNAGFGTISSSGTYTAPQAPPSPNTVIISAARKGRNPSVFAHAIIVNPVPAIQQSASTIITSTTDVQIVLAGSGFTAQSTVTTSGANLTLNLNSSSQATVTIPASIASVPGNYSLTVSNPSPGGGSASTTLTVFLAGSVSLTNHPQVARYSFTSPVDANVTVEFGTDTTYGLRTWTRPAPVGGGQVDILVAGMRAFTTYHMRATVQLQDGTIHNDMDHTFTTGGLDPSLLPNITVTQSSTLTPNPGVQVLNLVGGNPKVRAVVTDLQGNVIWYYDGLSGFPFPIKLLPNGNFLIQEGQSALGGSVLREIDLAGTVIRETTAPQINQKLLAMNQEAVAGAIHHDFAILPNGHVIVMGVFSRQISDLPGFVGQTIDVVADSLVELDENLDIVWTWNSFDHLDPTRHRLVFPSPPAPFDWTHGNAVVYDPADGNLLVSLRHQHWVLKIDYRDGLGTSNILWRFGIEGDFTLTNGGPPDWQYAQHYPFLLDNQQVVYRMALFDNGNDRPDSAGTPCDTLNQMVGPPCFSRAVIYEIDESLLSARVLWEQDLSFFAPFIGSTQVLPDGNILYDAGTINGTANAVMREVTQEASPQTVWQMDVSGQFVYRGERIPSLYPGVQW